MEDNFLGAFTQRRTEESRRFQRSCSANGIGGIDAVMEEFRRNGIDSPYDGEQDNLSTFVQNGGTGTYPELAGMGLPAMYLRQKSWPAPDVTPVMPMPRPSGYRRQGIEEVMAMSVPANDQETSPQQLTEYEMSLLNSLPRDVVYFLLDAVKQARDQQKRRARSDVIECRFCKKNGEKESYYRSHRLRWQGRVMCPVLRDYHCYRCGAHGDTAHTLKYCPLATDEERIKSTNMMRSIRQGRRRNWTPSRDVASNFGDTGPVVMRDGVVYSVGSAEALPLDPTWEALISKL